MSLITPDTTQKILDSVSRLVRLWFADRIFGPLTDSTWDRDTSFCMQNGVSLAKTVESERPATNAPGGHCGHGHI